MEAYGALAFQEEEEKINKNSLSVWDDLKAVRAKWVEEFCLLCV